MALTPDGEFITTIASKVEKHPERRGDSPLKGPYEAAQVPADDSRQRALTGELNVYYNSVVAAVREFRNLLLFGPGEAKGELHQCFKRKRSGARVIAVETEDKMTDPQIAAKVRTYFGSGVPRRQQGR